MTLPHKMFMAVPQQGQEIATVSSNRNFFGQNYEGKNSNEL